MTHTPGPWRVCRFDDGDIFIDGPCVYLPSKARASVCKMLPPCGNYTHGETYEKIDVRSENAANARLIAAAPELLSMLTRLTEKVERANALQHSGGKISAEDWSELYMLTNEARAAIAQAEGH